MRLRTTSSAIGIAFMAPSSRADCAPWAFGTSPIAPASPWQNGFAERLIGSIRRECFDHIIVSGEAHLRRIRISYAAYYDSVRTHRSLHWDAPSFRPIQQIGIIRSNPILGGRHHHYFEFEFSILTTAN